MGYSLTPAWLVSLDAERYRPSFQSTFSIDLVAVGLTYRFR
jgi:hypothetical protein